MVKYCKSLEENQIFKFDGTTEEYDKFLIYNPSYTEIPTDEEINEYEENILTEYKADRCWQINRRTDELIAAGFDHNGVHFDIKLEDQININTLFNLLNVGYDLTNQYFRASSEDYYFINNADFLTLVQTGNNVKTGHIQMGASLKNDVNISISIEEVDLVIDDR